MKLLSLCILIFQKLLILLIIIYYFTNWNITALEVSYLTGLGTILVIELNTCIITTVNLKKKKQKQKTKKTKKQNLDITCGVPQGSILGPHI